MTEKIYLSGHTSFGNRGCEAIVRSTIELLHGEGCDKEYLLPSLDFEKDELQWPELNEYNIKLVRPFSPPLLRFWVHLNRLPIPVIKKLIWPFSYSYQLKSQINSVDAVFSIGGDNYSLDYRIPTQVMAVDKLAMDMGKPVFLIGASVGPFEKEPNFVTTISKHLSRMTAIFVREGASYSYLTKKLKLTNVHQSADPAFALLPQPTNCSSYWPQNTKSGVVGINISPLIERYKNKTTDIRQEIVGFIRNIVTEEGFGVLLVPHVVPLDGSTGNNDRVYMQRILEHLSDLGDLVTITPEGLNASQIKDTISQLRFFVGSRTHSTIASISSGVPTISIAYSVKAYGINKDIFGDEKNVLNSSSISKKALLSLFDMLRREENKIKDNLAIKIPEVQQNLQSQFANILNFKNKTSIG